MSSRQTFPCLIKQNDNCSVRLCRVIFRLARLQRKKGHSDRTVYIDIAFFLHQLIATYFPVFIIDYSTSTTFIGITKPRRPFFISVLLARYISPIAHRNTVIYMALLFVYFVSFSFDYLSLIIVHYIWRKTKSHVLRLVLEYRPDCVTICRVLIFCQSAVCDYD